MDASAASAVAVQLLKLGDDPESAAEVIAEIRPADRALVLTSLASVARALLAQPSSMEPGARLDYLLARCELDLHSAGRLPV